MRQQWSRSGVRQLPSRQCVFSPYPGNPRPARDRPRIPVVGRGIGQSERGIFPPGAITAAADFQSPRDDHARMRYRLRTLLIQLALLPPLLAIGRSEWLRFSRVRALVKDREAELVMARQAHTAGPPIKIGFRTTLSGVRHAQLRLAREDAAARRESVAYRMLFPVAPK